MSTSFTFLRHAQTEANEKGVFSGSLDLPLSKEGKPARRKRLRSLRASTLTPFFMEPQSACSRLRIMY